MSASSCPLTEDHFLCSICLDVFTDPVTTPCGHNFCKTCITQHWDINVLCQCPNCNEVFNTRLELQVNTLISEMVARYRLSAEQEATGFGRAELVRAELVKTELQQMIQERRLKIQGIKDSVMVSRTNADREIADGVQIFTELKDAAEVIQAKVTERIEKKHKEIENRANVLVSELEQEISELQKRSAELEQLSLSEDHINLVQKLLSLKAASPSEGWKDVSVCRPSYAGEVRAASNQLMRMLTNEMDKLSETAELKTVQRFAVDVRLDPDTAHPQLILSDDGKQVCLGPVRRNLSDNPERFSVDPCILGMQLDSSRRFYFEVEVKGKIRWIVGVAKESVNRKETNTFHDVNGYWTLCCLKETKYAPSVPQVSLPLTSKPEKVGVFVDYDEGLVSFYDVDAARHIFSFSGCNFTQRILPFFCPSFNPDGRDSVPLTICPVNTAE